MTDLKNFSLKYENMKNEKKKKTRVRVRGVGRIGWTFLQATVYYVSRQYNNKLTSLLKVY